MAHIMSMVTEGVFEKFPTLKVVLYEGGIFWLPHVDVALRQELEGPARRDPLGEGAAERLHPAATSTRRPTRWKLSPTPKHLRRCLEMVEADRTLLFSGNYPELGTRRPLRR